MKHKELGYQVTLTFENEMDALEFHATASQYTHKNARISGQSAEILAMEVCDAHQISKVKTVRFNANRNQYYPIK